MPSRQSRSYCFTWNNPESIPDFEESGIPVTYWIYQTEIGENGTLHYQGFLQFERKCALSTAITQLDVICDYSHPHVEMMRGTAQEASDYCRKPGAVDGPWTGGAITTERQRKDLEEVKALVDQGASQKRLWEDAFPTMVRYHRSIAEYKRVCHPMTRESCATTLLIGTTGTGKSYYCRSRVPGAYNKSPGMWWDDYDSQPDVVIDEFVGSIPLHEFLQLTDPFSTGLRLQFKGGHVQVAPSRIFITTNTHPGDWWPNTPTYNAATRSAVYRRLATVYWFTVATMAGFSHVSPFSRNT